MSKYEKIKNQNQLELEKVLVEDETVIWKGKPKKSAFLINKVLIMLPFALIWLLFDGFMIAMIIKSGEMRSMLWFIIPFFTLHLMPVWIWLGNVLTANKKWQNTQYAVTDRRIIIQSGFVGLDYMTIYYKDIEKVNIQVDLIDHILNVGDIYFDLKEAGTESFLDVEDVYEIYPKLQKIVLDIQTDIEFPNDLRPEENHGYQTKYRP